MIRSSFTKSLTTAVLLSSLTLTAQAQTLLTTPAADQSGQTVQEPAAAMNTQLADPTTVEALKYDTLRGLPLNAERADIPTGVRLPLEQGERTTVCQELQGLLVDILDLRAQTKQAHWDLVGPLYLPLHEHFDEQVERYDGYADRIAERCLALGYSVDGRPATVAESSGLTAFPGGFIRDSEAIDLIADRLDTIARRTRGRMQRVGSIDPVTGNILQELVAGFEKDLWQIRVHKQ